MTMADPDLLASRPAEYDAKGKLVRMGYRVRLAPASQATPERTKQWQDGLRAFANFTLPGLDALVAASAQAEPEIGCPS